MKSRKTYFLGLLMLLLLAGCAPATSESPTTQPLATDLPIATLTPAPNASKTPVDTVTPIPLPTRRATLTSASDLTMTITPIASFTPKPTSKFTRTATATITRTSTLYVRPRGWFGPTYSPTPIPFACTVDERFSYPDYGQTFKPRSDFVAKWRVRNTGANMWHKDDILIGYVSGKKMHNDTRVDEILSYTLYVNDFLDVQIHMKPPKDPGIYTESWGLRKTNKKEFFCTFSVTIEVVGK